MSLIDEVNNRRTFAIISHPDAGKTTLTEKLLLYGGAIHLAGSVKARKTAKHAVYDWMEIEKKANKNRTKANKMRTVTQRVQHASVTIDGQLKSKIGKGLLVLVGIEDKDTQEDIEWLAKKITNLRIFDDENGVMNRSVIEAGGEIMVVSQFTLHASTKKGNRPSYLKASKPDIAIPMYKAFFEEVGLQLGKPVQTGTFGADMKIELLNDGPVTIIIDSQNKE